MNIEEVFNILAAIIISVTMLGVAHSIYLASHHPEATREADSKN